MNRAFTLVEVMVVLAIIAILAALLIPAINAAMEAASQQTKPAVVVERPVEVQQPAVSKPPTDEAFILNMLLANGIGIGVGGAGGYLVGRRNRR